MNRYRGRGLRADEKSAIIVVVIKATREIYPKYIEKLSLVFS